MYCDEHGTADYCPDCVGDEMQKEITTLRQQLEQAQARVAELESVSQGYQRDNKELQRLLNKQADKHIQRLRQQADEQEQPK